LLRTSVDVIAVTFQTAAELAVCDAFMRDGYVIAPARDRVALDRIRDFVVARTAAYLGVEVPADGGHFLDAIAARVGAADLNGLRLELIDDLLRQVWFRSAYFACGRELLEALVGNELAMQRGVGLSIQLPQDDGSVLPLHSDAWSEDSPFEAVLWIPLVDCFGTKSMFLLPPQADTAWRTRMHEFQRSGVEALFAAVEPELRWLNVPYGNVLVFTHTLMHGNRVNRESGTRWSINVRFKALFTPYSDKQLGDFFEPILVRPVSRFGMSYELPGGFDEI
jgi:sporadic carbohydrate cluster 2OG-Fe(II) oxygenase